MPILEEAARDSRETRVIRGTVNLVGGVTGLVGGAVWASDDDAGSVAPLPLLVIVTGGLMTTLGVVDLATTSTLEDLHARLQADPAAANEIARELEEHAVVARHERVTVGVIGVIAGVATLGIATWAGLEIDDPGSAFISAMGLGLVGSLELGLGIGLLTNRSRAEEAAADLRKWQRTGAGGAGWRPSGPIRLALPRIQVGSDSVGLVLGGTF